MVVIGEPISIRANRAAYVVTEVGAAGMLDDSFQLVVEFLVVAIFTVLLEIEGSVDWNCGLVFSSVVIKTFQLYDQKLGAKRYFLGLLSVAALFAFITTVSIDRFVDVVLEIVGKPSAGDLGGDCQRQCRVCKSPSTRLMAAFPASYNAGGDYLGGGLKGRESPESIRSVWVISL